MKFSPNGKYILLGTRQNTLMLLDAFKGTMVQRFEGNFSGDPTLSIECGFSPDSKYVVSGSANSRQNLFLWNLDTGKEVAIT